LNGTVAPDATLTIRIPRGLVDNVTTVVIDSQQGANGIEFSINEFGPEYTTVGVNIGSQAPYSGSLKLAIY
jgi:hypothetical protein